MNKLDHKYRLLREGLSSLRLLSILVIPLFAAVTIACESVAEKAEKVTETVEDQVVEKSEALVEKILPHFDADKPDTKDNKARFKEFLQVDLSPDVKNIFCFGDEIGIDSDYQFSFNCNAQTAKAIVAKHQMALDTVGTNYEFDLQEDFKWWDKKKIKALPLYRWNGEHYYKYFWYDEKEGKAYFFDFDI